jgi:putative oxidoreductase
MTVHRLPVALLTMRLSIFLVMFMWTVDKFVNPGHATRIFEYFYFIPGVESTFIYGLAVAEMLLLAVFLLGVQKRWSYGLVLLLHSVSTFSSFRQYLDPFEGSHLLFFAAWPMWAACVALYLLRDQDTLGTWR